LLYRGTALVVVFLTVYWLVQKRQQKVETKKKAEMARLPSARLANTPTQGKLR
jgi:preprotein translocase subunit YajC